MRTWRTTNVKSSGSLWSNLSPESHHCHVERTNHGLLLSIFFSMCIYFFLAVVEISVLK